MFEAFEPITICDKFLLFVSCQLETITLWETSFVSLDSLIESDSFDLIKFSKICIHDDLLPSYGQDPALNSVLRILLKQLAFFHEIHIIIWHRYKLNIIVFACKNTSFITIHKTNHQKTAYLSTTPLSLISDQGPQ